jgi:hypothetical protein
MVIFRGRRKIFRGMERSLAEFGAAQPGDLPARQVLDPLPSAGRRPGIPSSKRSFFDRSAPRDAEARDREASGI